MIHIKAPDNHTVFAGLRLFLGGSIEMGRAENWQEKTVAHLEKKDYNNLIVLNPRRDDWDSSWDQSPVPGTKFYEQVTWELAAQEKSQILCYYFAKDTLSPITLLELGLFGFRKDKKVVVYVDDDYQRRGNVIVTCDMYGLMWSNNLDDFLTDIELAIEE